MRAQTMEAKIPMEKEQTEPTVQTWQLTENSFDPETNFVHETLFALGNGYIGIRGGHEEAFLDKGENSQDSTFINGFYESQPLHYPESAYALAKEHQFMLTVPNGKRINFSLDNENFDLFQGKIDKYQRSVDFRTGILCRTIEWTSPSGHKIIVNSRRLVSFKTKNLFAIEYEIKSVNFSGTLALQSILDGQLRDADIESEPRYGAAVAAIGGRHFDLLSVETEENFLALVQRTRNSKLMLVSAIEMELTCPGADTIKPEQSSNKERVEEAYSIKVKAGETVKLTKYGAYFTSRDNPETELLPLAKKALKEARRTGFDNLVTEQKEFLTDFWHHADLEITGDDDLQQGVRFNQYHLLQSVGRDGKTSIAAKGLTGEGYGGHYFWDAETYALPFYLYTKPEIAKRMLEYRYSILDKARLRAREMSHDKGALYTWRTIAGEECSAYYPGGTAQYHINADIAYAIKQYYEATADEDFMLRCGAEMILETARIWIGIGSYIARKNDQFCINEVTGPDEYTAMVDNNFYTNAMAQMHLKFAAFLAAKLKNEHPKDFNRISKSMDLSTEEPKEWLRAADAMYLPYDKELGIHEQDDTFLSKKKWDFNEMSRPSHNLPLHYHYLVIYRHQVCKQADVLLALFLLGNQYTLEEKKRDYDYYEEITTHDSSLSHSTFSVMASEVGYLDKAYQYFMKTARGDLDDLHGNTSYGVHIAAMAGTWMAVVNGFAGMRAYEGKLQFSPCLPEKWQHYGFRIHFQSKLLQIDIDAQKVQYRLLEGDSLAFKHHNVSVQLSQAAPVKVLATSSPYADMALTETNGKKPEIAPLKKAGLSK
jgi:alpha,alpha-trehalose phosphorylase